MNNQTALGSLNVSQSILKQRNDLYPNYDLAISAIGWETRSNHALPMYFDKSNDLKFIKFSSTSEYFLKRKYNSEIEARKIIGNDINIVEMKSSIDFNSNSSIIQKIISDKKIEIRQPISLVIDISCIPKRYFLFLIGLGFSTDLIGRIDLIYSEGHYSPVSSLNEFKQTERGFVSDGEWASIQIPYLEDSVYLPSIRNLFVSVGAEVTLAMPTVERFEATSLRLYHVSDSDNRFPPKYLSSEEQALSTLRSLPGASSINFSLGNIIDMTRDVLENHQGNTTCLAIGAKPHALALGIAALANKNIQVVCRSPRAYVPNDVLAAGPIHRFLLEDRFEPMACWSN